jgi:transcriptional regulator with XRE-family HTH domain
MTSAFEILGPRELEAYGFARVRDTAFDAVNALWKRRKAGGMTQKDLADRIGRDPGWVSRNLRGPGNWTLRTIGAFIVALNGEAEITIFGLEDTPHYPKNADAYSGYGDTTRITPPISTEVSNTAQKRFALRFRPQPEVF